MVLRGWFDCSYRSAIEEGQWRKHPSLEVYVAMMVPYIEDTSFPNWLPLWPSATFALVALSLAARQTDHCNSLQTEPSFGWAFSMWRSAFWIRNGGNQDSTKDVANPSFFER